MTTTKLSIVKFEVLGSMVVATNQSIPVLVLSTRTRLDRVHLQTLIAFQFLCGLYNMDWNLRSILIHPTIMALSFVAIVVVKHWFASKGCQTNKRQNINYEQQFTNLRIQNHDTERRLWGEDDQSWTSCVIYTLTLFRCSDQTFWRRLLV